MTIRYHAGRPLGMLLASVDLADFAEIGTSATLKPTRSGPLYFKINEASSGLSDNSGTLRVTIQQHRQPIIETFQERSGSSRDRPTNSSR